MTLQDVYSKFPDNEKCISFLESTIWNNKPTCPYCGNKKPSKIKDTFRYQCNSCRTSFSVLIGTPFQKARKDLQVWFYAIGLLSKWDNDYSCRQLSKEIGVTKDTGCKMFNLIKRAMIHQNELIQKINKEINV